MSGHVSRRKLFEPMLLDNISRVSACNPYHGMQEGESTDDFVARLAQELDDEFQRVGPETVCAFVAEPVVGAVGCILHIYKRAPERQRSFSLNMGLAIPSPRSGY